MAARVLILFGFGAKAGAFPLHIWLPKAHPVAPAPASALLSGMLTKAGVFGMLVLTCYLMRGCAAFGDVIFRLGVITMFLGALLAIFSTNLKRTLACSSLSQIGFIMVGVGLQGLCAGENGLAAYGTIQHMVNHSLFKLVLFLCAGVVAMNAHALSLNEVRGFGRKKPLLHFCFLMGMLGIAGIPGFSGYASKSLLHEGLLEYIHELTALGEGALPYQIAEWVFIISGGMTLCYMFKLYLCLFWQKNPTRQAEYDGMRKYLSAPSGIALGLCAALIPVLGLLPGVLMSGIGELARPFFHAALPAHMPIAYFSGENLLGAAKSIGIGVILYALNWQFIMSKEKKGSRSYPERWPKWLDLEDLIYRPVLRLLIAVGYGVALVLDRLMDGVIVALRAVGGLLARVADGLCDGLILGIRRIFLPPLSARQPVPVGNRFTYAFGRFCDGASVFITRLFHLRRPAAPATRACSPPRWRRPASSSSASPAPSASACSCSAWGCSLRWRTCCGCNGTLDPAALCRRAFFPLGFHKKSAPAEAEALFESQYWLLRLRSKHSRQYTGRSPLGWKGTWVVQPQPSQITS